MDSYDVVVIGGGPAGATFASMLAARGQLSVALFEAETFPRDHIGESYTQRVTTILQESGALAKVLASSCYVRKYGGYYAWGDGDPAVSLFEHSAWERDGILRWSFHGNRAELDTILLEHAASQGVHVEQGCPVEQVHLDDEHVLVLADGRRIRCHFVVEANGRINSLITGKNKRFLSEHKNVALWTHVRAGQAAQEAPGDWNLFRRLGRSAIGSYAFAEGWFWYIPVPKMVAGERVLTHSLGLVTDPQALKKNGRHLSAADLLTKARSVPILKDLLRSATPIHPEVSAATNYSMIGERFCSHAERWLSIGDSSYFVDPLFSSGLAFAVNHAASAALLVAEYFADKDGDDVRTLFADYDDSWHRIAESFALVLDQWYFAINKSHPSGDYWQRRTRETIADVRLDTFNALVDTAVSPDLLLVLTKGQGGVDRLDEAGPLRRVLRDGGGAASGTLVLDHAVRMESSVSLAAGRSKEQLARSSFDAAEAERRLRAYWDDPLAHGGLLPPLYGEPAKCLRFRRAGDWDNAGVIWAGPPQHATALEARLRTPHSIADLLNELPAPEQLLLRRLHAAGLLTDASA